MGRFSIVLLMLMSAAFCTVGRAAVMPPQDYVIKEGSGLADIFLGMTSDEAIRSIGEPDQNLYGFVFVRQLPDSTVLSYRIADDRIVSINFKGGTASKFITLRGAKLGMLRSKIVSLYGAPEAEAVNKLFYHSQGISFFFDNDVLYEISIFPGKKTGKSSRE